MEVNHIKYGNEIIKYEICRKKVKNINLNVKPNLKIIISANYEVPLDYINNFVMEKAEWIIKQLTYFKNAQPDNIVEKEYVSGETFKYLGKQYRLKVVETIGVEEVKLFQGYLRLYIKDKKNIQKKKSLIDEWFRTKAYKKFKVSFEKIYPLIEKYGVSKPELGIRIMKARWGSCLYKKNIILLNLDLIKAPTYCIEYVLLHEMIHFIHKYHNKDFYYLMTVLMPDWKKRKEILDKEVVREL